MIADVIHLMDSLDIQKAHIIGYSMGAEIALRLAIEHPERVLSLGLGGSGWSGQADYENYRLMADSLDKSASFGPVLREMTPAGDKGPTDEEISAIDEMLQNQDIHALIAVARAMSEIINITEVELKNLGIPVLGISGELDPERGNLEKMTGVIPDYSMKVLIGRDHVGALSDPLYTLEHIEFLTNQER